MALLKNFAFFIIPACSHEYVIVTTQSLECSCFKCALSGTGFAIVLSMRHQRHQCLPESKAPNKLIGL